MRLSVIGTETGYEIIEFMNKRGGEVRPLDEVGQAIETTLKMQRFAEET